jgi:hypothetical protein
MPQDSQIINAFYATVDKVLGSADKMLDRDKKTDRTSVYNGNKDFDDKDARYYGAITYRADITTDIDDYAFPFDKNNITFPQKGETVIIFKIENNTFWLPYTVTPYPNYRRRALTFDASKITIDGNNATTEAKIPTKGEIKVNEKIKFLKPKSGDTIISGRDGNTIRFSDTFLSDDEKASSPSIFIRNLQDPELDDKKISILVEEDFNKDGSSIYITSNKVKIPYNITEKKSNLKTMFDDKKAYSLDEKGKKKIDYPKDKELNGNQIYVNTDRILLSARVNEFLIFGQKQVAVFSGGRFSVDAMNDVYMFANKSNVILHCGGKGKQVFLNSDGGEVYIGKNDKPGKDGDPVQPMVLGGELVKILSDLIDTINKQWYNTPCGPTPPMAGPNNIADFKAIQKRLKVILSESNFLSKKK